MDNCGGLSSSLLLRGGRGGHHGKGRRRGLGRTICGKLGKRTAEAAAVSSRMLLLLHEEKGRWSAAAEIASNGNGIDWDEWSKG
mmetsp:Transcript_19682/g.41488  ORF Transcript_19682/g.41488 Transcript_19682/m.41488 type:complete len:84 (-) Transcript_19682:147-398(-)